MVCGTVSAQDTVNQDIVSKKINFNVCTRILETQCLAHGCF